jgi:cytochrome d ubiquinol oxidase subunit I
MSAFWILSANSWMQTPAAYLIENGRFIPESWLGVIFNPSFPYRLVHMVLAAFLTTSFVVGAVAAWHLLKDRTSEPARIMFAMAVMMAAVVAPIQVIAGDQHGLNTQKHQPAKIAAMEGHFKTQSGAPLILFGIPDMDAAETKYKIEIPKLGSLILGHSFDATVVGLDQIPREDWPNVPIVFWSFRVMVGIGMLMLLYGIAGAALSARRRLFKSDLYLRWAVLMGPTGFVAILSGWFVSEVGRQPFVV